MASTASDLIFCKADKSDGPALVALMAKVLKDGDSLHAEHYNLNKWQWKYFQLPNCEAQIYLCKEADQLLGYYHCPTYFGSIDGQEKKFAMVQDVGVSEAARGKGVFRKLAEYATRELLKSGVNFIYTFPNKKSIHTFLKYNAYQTIETYSTFVMPVTSSQVIAAKLKLPFLPKMLGYFVDNVYGVKLKKIRKDCELKLEEKLTQEHVDLFLHFNKNFKNSLTRDYTYLHWRFEQKPHHRPLLISLSRGGKILALAFVSKEVLLGSKTAVILDFACLSPIDFQQLISLLRKQASRLFGEKIGLLYSSASSTNNKLFTQAGFFKIPEKLNPRPLHLLGKNVSENEQEVLNPKNWNFTLSEWDVL